ncbi:hypothetical protein EPN52_00695 [bacterium]|nr:MAG: hypothetical protein EPN52_00695 [bacterium]
MNSFFRVLLIALAAFFVASRLPLLFVDSLLCWAIIIVAAWKYPQLVGQKMQQISSPVGYAVGMGALLGAAVNFGGVLANLLWHVIAGSMAASLASQNGLAAGAAITNGFGAFGDLFQTFSAPFWGALLGVVGGLIGGATIPKSTADSPAHPDGVG